MSKSLAIAYSMKKKKASGGCVESGNPTMNYADGGEVEEVPEYICAKCGEAGEKESSGLEDGAKALDMISKIMEKRKMAMGGMAKKEEPVADFLSNDFDYLDSEDVKEEKDSIVSRAMKKRKKA